MYGVCATVMTMTMRATMTATMCDTYNVHGPSWPPTLANTDVAPTPGGLSDAARADRANCYDIGKRELH